ncbi:MAG: hypothetical protein A4E25_00014 [Methanobacterium sp. PtaB.Bin024]|jgi:hypothetical protein|nr:MAG: hypothetical protein A4E25_00014 [Methanobacterium sp. PtaB.Bin024]
MKQRSISEIFFKLPYELSEAERKTQILLLIPFGLITSIILSYIWFGLLIGLNFIPFFIAFCLILLGVIFILYFWDNLDHSYGLKPFNSPFQLSYQGYVIILLCEAPAFFWGMFSLGFTSNNIWFGLGGAVALVYPILGMFLRIKTFNDDSIIIPGGKAVLPDKVVLPDGQELSSGKSEVVETVRGFGFMPISYWILASAIGLYTVGRGFSGIHLYLTGGYPSLEAAVFAIVLGLLLQTVYLFPDKLNNIVPIELRSKKGFIFMFILVFVLFGLSQFVFSLLW